MGDHSDQIQIQKLNLLSSLIRKETAEIHDLLQAKRKTAYLEDFRDKHLEMLRILMETRSGHGIVQLSGVSRERDMLKSKILEIKEREKMVKEGIEKFRVQQSRLVKEKKRKDRKIEELKSTTEWLNSQPKVAAKVIEGMRESIKQFEREKEEIEKMNKEYASTVEVLESDVKNLEESLRSVCAEETLMRDRFHKLEESLDAAVKKENEMQMEKSIEVLNERADAIEKVLEMLQKKTEHKRREVDEAIRVGDGIEQAKAQIQKLQTELDRLNVGS